MDLLDKCALKDWRLIDKDKPVDEQLQDGRSAAKVNATLLCAAITHNCSVNAVKLYLEHYREEGEEFQAVMHRATSALYYAIARNLPELVSLLLEYGLHPDGKDTDFIPPIAFAIIYGYAKLQNTTEIVKILLAAGVDPRTIPEDMWINYLDQPQKGEPEPTTTKDPVTKWMAKLDDSRARLVPALNLSQRYYLFRASQIPRPTTRSKQLADMHDVTKLFKAPYHLIGQSFAVNTIQTLALHHIAMTIDEPSPLILAFAGPPGHGKTELAEQLGGLLSIKHVVIDCSHMSTDTELFGSKNGYIRCQEGSRLNNFLAQNNGLCSVVFLDEIDKSQAEVYNSLLTVFSEGRYEDRRTNRVLDCNKTIWILASNLGDEVIADYYERTMKTKKEEEKATVDISPLITDLRDLFIGQFSAPLVSRIDDIIPFFPFSLGEQAVVAHKFLLKFSDKICKNIDLRPEVKRHMGHCVLSVQDDGKLCKFMAESGYDRTSGARGLKREAVKIQGLTRTSYNAVEGEVTEELNNGPLQKFEAKLIKLPNNKFEIGVTREYAEGFYSQY
ncbi:P-loop containing nucleoside triphosphate hydrolase protein [Massariosphaeria phaeospora]|uniref:P-loop containing nucleoside triphosphate hydrolase protein n=1 Tax=Massariosphaeria phaeospora TaxID=100035 RepID=A0A7C8MGM1_9PLEO|nr:P-loop containing nucleoside triphosphate hydrolase protein [Massariosphaeria phaeospora]